MIVDCQRWRDRRPRYRPAGERFDTSRAAVQVIDEGAAKAFVRQHHYSGTYPAARVRAGLFIKDRFSRERLAGVAVFSVPMHQAIVPNYFGGLAPNAGVELGRLVLLDEVPGNAESWFVARAFRALKGELAGVDGVLSYSDPVERLNEAGELVKRGHVGIVYQALNATYLGRARGGTQILASNGQVVNRRTLSKLRNDEVGAGYAYEQLRELGAPERKPLEDGKAYAERAILEGGFRKMRHPGNHTYVWWLGDRARRPTWSTLPYPK